MANELIRMKSGFIKNIEKDETGHSPVNIQAGTIYFAVDDQKETGKILYDVDSTHRVVMSTQSEYADYAGEAAKATGITGIYPVRGTQTASTNLWTGTISGVTELIDGLTIAYYLPFAGTTTAATLQLNFEDNGTYSASVPIYYTGTTVLSNQYDAGSTIILTYWEAENKWSRADYNTDNNRVGYALRTNSTVMTVTDTARYYKLYFTSADNTQWVPASVNSTNNATSARPVNQRPINPFGRIVYMSASTNFAAGANLTATSIWDQYNITLGYSFNRTGAALTLTPKLPVYIQCTLQDNGSAIIDATIPYIQTLPQTEMPNKIYIYLGIATSATAVELFKDHPVYWFKGGRIRQYTDINEANGTESGLMSASDKAKFDDGLVIAGNTIPVGGTLTASDLRTSLGLSNAMHYIGKATVAITDGSTTDPKIGGNATTLVSGDVVIDSTDSREYVWNGSAWELLGGDSSYKVTQTAVTDAAYSGSDTATTFVSAVTQNTNGEITVTKRKLPTYNNYSHPTYTQHTAAAVKVGNDATGHVVIGAALTAADVGAATSGHTHTTSLSQTGTATINLAANTAYTLTAGGTSVVFKTPADTTYTFDGTYNASTNKAATVSTVTNAINALDGNLNNTTPGAGKTLTAFSQTDGKVSATFGNISITKSQVSDFPTAMTPTSHTHGKITNDGKIASTDNVAIANNDRLIISDASDSYILKNTSIVFDGSTATKALTQKGTWETFNNYSLPLAASGTRGGIKIGYTSSGKNYAVQLSSEQAFVNVPWTDTYQNVTLKTTTKGYITAVETAPTGTAAAQAGIADTGVYLTTTAGQINATSYKVAETALISYNTTTGCIEITT